SVTLNNRLVELLSVVLVTSVLQRIDVQSNIGDNRLCLKSSSCNEDRRGHHTCNTDDSQSLRGELLRRQNALTQLGGKTLGKLRPYVHDYLSFTSCEKCAAYRRRKLAYQTSSELFQPRKVRRRASANNLASAQETLVFIPWIQLDQAVPFGETHSTLISERDNIRHRVFRISTQIVDKMCRLFRNEFIRKIELSRNNLNMDDLSEITLCDIDIASHDYS